MKKFTVYMTFFGKKMKTEVMARTEAEAKEQVRNSIKFDAVKPEPRHPLDELLDLCETLRTWKR